MLYDLSSNPPPQIENFTRVSTSSPSTNFANPAAGNGVSSLEGSASSFPGIHSHSS